MRTPSKPLALASLLVASFAINLDTTIVNVALPSLVRELHATTTQLQWVVDAYNLVFAALLLTFGSPSDRFGRKGMLLAGLAVFGGASLAGGFTHRQAKDPARATLARGPSARPAGQGLAAERRPGVHHAAAAGAGRPGRVRRRVRGRPGEDPAEHLPDHGRRPAGT